MYSTVPPEPLSGLVDEIEREGQARLLAAVAGSRLSYREAAALVLLIEAGYLVAVERETYRELLKLRFRRENDVERLAREDAERERRRLQMPRRRSRRVV